MVVPARRSRRETFQPNRVCGTQAGVEVSANEVVVIASVQTGAVTLQNVCIVSRAAHVAVTVVEQQIYVEVAKRVGSRP